MSDVDAFVVHMRHELRTPINAIVGYSQLLLEEEDGASLSAAERRDLERVADSGKQLLRIITDVLDPVGLAAATSPSTPSGCATRCGPAHQHPRLSSSCCSRSTGTRRLATICGGSMSLRLAWRELIDTVGAHLPVRVGAAHHEPLLASVDATRAAEALEANR